MNKTLYWIRNDHRLHDNRTLLEYAKSDQGLIYWAPTPSLRRASRKRLDFYLQSLEVFSKALQRHQQTVICDFNSTIEEQLPDLLKSYQITTVVYSKEVGVEEEKTESRVVEIAVRCGVRACGFFQETLLAPEDFPDVLTPFPKIFTDFRKKVEKTLTVKPPLNEPQAWPRPLSWLGDGPKPPSLQAPVIPARAGEEAGLSRLQEYFWQLDRAKNYKDTRNGMLDWNDSTKFSLWLATGALSPRRIYAELKEYEQQRIQNESTYWIFFELLWRDYFKFYAQQQGPLLFTKQKHPTPEPSQAQELFSRWCQGKTGDDFIDANMRELLQTGWMSNRGRQNVASFLAKQWKLPWTWGADWFEKNLLDYDVTSNWGNWSYFSGVGSDPRDRAFNTATQAKHYDPDGSYRKRWLT